MNRFLFLFIVLLFNFNSVQAQMGGQEQVYLPDVEEESFIYQLPKKWLPYQAKSDAKITTFAFPTGQEPRDWEESLQYDQYSTTAGVKDTKDVYTLRTQSAAKKCADYEETLMSSATENGYSMTQWTQRCGLAKNTNITSLNKVILGNERLYTVTKTWKLIPDEEEMEEWEEYFQMVYVCDPTINGSPCTPPSSGGGRGGQGGGGGGQNAGSGGGGGQNGGGNNAGSKGSVTSDGDKGSDDALPKGKVTAG